MCCMSHVERGSTPVLKSQLLESISAELCLRIAAACGDIKGVAHRWDCHTLGQSRTGSVHRIAGGASMFRPDWNTYLESCQRSEHRLHSDPGSRCSYRD